MNGSPTRQLLLIANPISGGGKGRLLAPQLAAALERRGVKAQVYFTSAPGDATQRAAAASDEPWHGLVAIGGDGTVNEVLNGMRDHGQPLGVLPVGTANVLAIELGLPRRIEAAADVLSTGHLRELAVGLAGERRFLLFCGAGVDGAIVDRLSQVRTGTLGKHKWFGPVVHTVWHWPRFSLRATFADGSSLDDLTSVLVTRVRNFGGVLHLTPDVSVDSGLLHVLCFRQRSRSAWLWQGVRGFCGGLRAGRRLEVRATSSVRIDGEAPFQIDGDFAGRSPLLVSLSPTTARVFAPK